jgi:multisubunit Na+/H+ antiporter MnhF subunit
MEGLMDAILTLALQISLAIHIILISVSVWRVWKGENIIDRILAAELISTLMLAVLVLVALLLSNSIYLDVALGLAALGFISTITLAKYVVNREIY